MNFQTVATCRAAAGREARATPCRVCAICSVAWLRRRGALTFARGARGRGRLWGKPCCVGLGALMAHPARQVASPFQRRRGNPAHSGGWAGVRDSYTILSTTYGSSCACTRVRVSARCSTLHRADSFCLGLGLCPAVLWSARSVDGVLVSRRGMGTLKQICRGLPVWPPRIVLLYGGARARTAYDRCRVVVVGGRRADCRGPASCRGLG